MSKNEIIALIGMALLAGSFGYIAGPAWGIGLAGLSLLGYSLREYAGKIFGNL